MTGAEAVEARTITETGAVDTVAGLVTVTVTDTTGSGPGAEQKKTQSAAGDSKNGQMKQEVQS